MLKDFRTACDTFEPCPQDFSVCRQFHRQHQSLSMLTSRDHFSRKTSANQRSGTLSTAKLWETFYLRVTIHSYHVGDRFGFTFSDTKGSISILIWKNPHACEANDRSPGSFNSHWWRILHPLLVEDPLGSPKYWWGIWHPSETLVKGILYQ